MADFIDSFQLQHIDLRKNYSYPMDRNLKFLFIINAIFNAIGAVILILCSAQMMKIFEINLTAQQNFICYLLGACSFRLAILSFYGRKITSKQSLHLIVLTFAGMYKNQHTKFRVKYNSY